MYQIVAMKLALEAPSRAFCRRCQVADNVASRHPEMEVSEVEDGTAVQANHVYTIPSNTFMFIKDGKLRLTEIVKRDGLRMPIDFFFRSLAEDQRENAIAVDNQACHPPDLSYPRGSVRAAPGKQDGYLEPKRKADMTRAGVKEFVNKPYRLDDVVSTIQNVIERNEWSTLFTEFS